MYFFNRADDKYIAEFIKSESDSNREKALDDLCRLLDYQGDGGTGHGAIEQLEAEIQLLRGFLGYLIYHLFKSGSIDKAGLENILKLR